jgi:hypothetical protein
MDAQSPAPLDEHPLSAFFTELVESNFRRHLEMRDESVTDYVSALLFDFTRADHVYKIRDARGRAIEDVGEMLLESDPLGRAENFEREREVRKHVGDFTLFFSGMFPESIRNWRLRRYHVGSFVDYMKAGKESYQVVAAFNQFEYRPVAPLFRKLEERFEECVYGLHLVKQQIESKQSMGDLIH